MPRSFAKQIALGCAVLGLCGASACATKFNPAPAMGTGGAPSTGATPAGGAVASGSGGGPASPGATAGTGGASGSAGGSAAVGGGVMTGKGGAGGMGAPAGGGGAGGSMMAAGDAGPAVDSGGPAPVQACPATVLPPGDTMGSVQVGGQPRNYILHVPASYTGKMPVPLVTDWHPILFNDSFEQGNSMYQAKSDKEGFIVVFPDGIDNAWNIGDCCTTSRMVDDVGFARALIDKLKQEACIDPKRIYAVGYSMGGGMSYKLACDAADIIAAVAPAAFELMTEAEWPCHPKRPITVISFNGTADFVVPYTGGDVNPPNGLMVTNHFLGAPATFKHWAELNGCTDMPADKGGGCQTYSACKDGVEVTLCTSQGGGHVTGDPNVAWDTLKRHTLP
jgi:polyhydroxybutyrate depolymerase